MKHFRWLVIAFLVGFTIFFNLERLDFAEQNTIDIDSVVYILGFIASVLILSIPGFGRVRLSVLVVGWSLTFIAAKLTLMLFFGGRPLLSGVYTYLSITELSLLLISIWLAHKLTQSVNDFEDAVENVTFADTSTRVRQLAEANEEIKTEMFRSRHNHHPLSVIVIEPEASSIRSSRNRLLQEAQGNMIRNYITNHLAMILSRQLRRSDLVLAQRDRNRVVLVCPDTNQTDSSVLIDYITEVVTKQLGLSVACGTASFPQEALTFEDLIRRAELAIENSTTVGPPEPGNIEVLQQSSAA